MNIIVNKILANWIMKITNHDCESFTQMMKCHGPHSWIWGSLGWMSLKAKWVWIQSDKHKQTQRQFESFGALKQGFLKIMKFLEDMFSKAITDRTEKITVIWQSKVQNYPMLMDKEIYLNVTKEMYTKHLANIRYNGQELKEILLHSGTKQDCPISPYLFNIVPDVLTRERKRMKKSNRIGQLLVIQHNVLTEGWPQNTGK